MIRVSICLTQTFNTPVSFFRPQVDGFQGNRIWMMKKRYGMVIDLKRCIGCDACTIACRQTKGTTKGILYAKILKYELGRYPDAKLAFLPVLCMHCAEPPCEEVCPTGATIKREDGIVVIDPQKCIGCNSCVIACPYGARNSFRVKLTYFEGKKTAFEISHEKAHISGKVEKCDFCLDRLKAGREPACVRACPADARIFGDLNDADSPPSKLIVEKEGLQLNPHWETDCAVYYI
jgi:molybdopterin-containing oxidoreductase family iron-sulfur binding subunit